MTIFHKLNSNWFEHAPPFAIAETLELADGMNRSLLMKEI
jgi:hypothetical protein